MAASIIDSLVTEIVIDTSKAKKGQDQFLSDLKKTKDEGKKQTREIEDNTKNSLQGLQKVATTAFGLFAAFTAGRGIKDFAIAMTQINANLGRTAYTLDTSVKEIGKWRGAIRLGGGDADAFTNSVAGIVSQFQQFAITGEAGGAIPYFRALGVQLSDTEGHMRPFSEWILDVADKLSTMDPARAAAWGRNLGLDPGTVNAVIHGRKAMQDYLEVAKKYGPDDQDAAAAQKLQLAYRALDEASARLGMTLMTRFAPTLQSLADLLRSTSDWLQAHPNVLTAIAVGLGAIGTAITVGLSVSAIATAASGLGALFKVLRLLSATELLLGLAQLAQVVLPGVSAAFLEASVAIEATPIGWIIAGIGLLVVAGYELIEHWTDVKNSWSKIWGNMGNDVTSFADKGPWHRAILDTVTLGFAEFLNKGNGVGRNGDVPAEGQGLLAALGNRESGGNYNALYGGGSFSGFGQFPQWGGKMGPQGMSHAAGAYQFQPGTWADAQKALGLKDFSPASQDRAAWWLAQRDYAKNRPGRDLLADLRSGNPAILADIGAALHGTWAASSPGLLGGSAQAGSRAGVGAPTAALAGSAMTNNRAYDLSKETHIGTINVDASGARDSASTWRSIGGAVDNLDMATQANTGPM